MSLLRAAIAFVLMSGAAASGVSAQEGSVPAEQTAPPEQAVPVATFDVWEYRVLGNTVLPAPAIERAVYPHLGKARNFADVEAARASLELAYREAGYGTVFVDLPEQDVDRGIVRLRITEGRIDRVRVTGARYFSNKRIRAALPSIAPGTVPKLGDVQAEINALNRQTGDRSVVPVLKAGRTPGTVDISVRVADEHPWHASVELNDRYTAQTSKQRASVVLSYDNLWQLGHSLSLQYQTAPRNREDTEAFVASYVFPLRRFPGTTFVLYGVDSKTDVAALGNINVLGSGNIFGARAIHSLAENGALSSSFSLGLDYKDFLENIQLAEEDPLLTPIRYLNWSAGWSGAMRQEGRITSFGVTGNFGVRRLFNDSSEFLDKRYKGAANYFYVRANLQQVYDLAANFQVLGKVSGQYSPQPLVSNEQFGLGGADTVRGYLESSQLGDYGLNTTVELRNDFLSRPLGLPRGGAYLAVFWDAGVAAIHEPLPSQARRVDLASFGLGLRINDWHGLDLGLDWAQALVNSGRIDAGDDRVHFLMRASF
jgi:hemolysin activation/secretion protein